MQALQRLARIGAQLVGQGLAEILVRAQRLGQPVGPVQGEDELAPELLAQRELPGEAGQLGDQLVVPAEAEIGVDAPLLRLQPVLDQLWHLGVVQRR